tara:strand:- start:2871 stop:3467 length:597 start_codon:yes stop_codon:yes gene_type:complete
MLSKIKVYGRLARFLGERTFEAEINSTLDAIKFLTANFHGLESHMIEQNYCVKVGEYEINDKELNVPIGQQEIKIVPVVVGSKGIGKIIVGAVLVGAVIATGGFGGAAIGTFGIGAGSIGVGTVVAGIGANLILTGAAEMMTPVENNTNNDDPNSFSFNGILNTINAGVSIPVVYGEVFTGSIIVSAGLDTDDSSEGT